MNNTRVILLVIVHSVVHAALAAEIADIVFNVNKKYLEYECVPAYRTIVLEDEPTSIQIYFNTSIDIANVRWHFPHNVIKFYKTKYNTFLAPKNYTFNCNDDIKCLLFAGLGKYPITSCESRLHIRDKNPAAEIYLNSYAVFAKRTSLEVKDYDADALYYFNPGETVVIDCKNSRQSGLSKISYHKNAGGTLWETVESPRYIEDVHIKLTEESHSNYVDCYYNSKITTRFYEYLDVSVTRIFFKLNAGFDKSIITLHINGMYVRPTRILLMYDYVYYDGERVDISCESRNDDHLINLDYDGHTKRLLSQDNVTLYLNKENDKSNVICTARDRHTKNLKTHVNVRLIQSLSDFYITGLNKAHILQQYPETENSSVIYYQFTDNETMTLKCLYTKFSFALQPTWTFNGSSVSSEYHFKTGIAISSISLMMQATYHNLKIKCILEEINMHPPNTRLKEIIIRLVYKMAYQPDIEEKASKFATKWIWISCSIVMIVIATIIILNITKNYKKERTKRQCNARININFTSRSHEEEPEDRPIVEREQESLPYISEERGLSNDTTMYSEVYYEPSFPRRTPTDSDNEYAYADCAHLGERHASAFDAVATRIALEKAKRINKSDYSNLKEICRPGHCVLRAQDRK